MRCSCVCRHEKVLKAINTPPTGDLSLREATTLLWLVYYTVAGFFQARSTLLRLAYCRPGLLIYMWLACFRPGLLHFGWFVSGLVYSAVAGLLQVWSTLLWLVCFSPGLLYFGWFISGLVYSTVGGCFRPGLLYYGWFLSGLVYSTVAGLFQVRSTLVRLAYCRPGYYFIFGWFVSGLVCSIVPGLFQVWSTLLLAGLLQFWSTLLCLVCFRPGLL